MHGPLISPKFLEDSLRSNHLDPRIKSAEGLWKINLWTIFKPYDFS